MIGKRLCLILLAAVLVATVSAALVNAEGPDHAATGYAVRPAAAVGMAQPLFNKEPNSLQGSIMVTAVPGSIGPGEKEHHTKNVDRYIETLNVDLQWSNPGVGLKLLVYSPGGTQFGPWSDGDDGQLDHEINMDIDNPRGIEQGQWEYYVIYDTGVERTDYIL